jgi:hypothetical protein
MKKAFLAANLIFGIPGLVLGVAALTNVTQNPVAALVGVTTLALASACLWLAKESLVGVKAKAP